MAHQGGVGLQHQLAVLVGADVAGDDDIGTEALVDALDVHGAVQDVTGRNRLVVNEFLVHLNDLHGRDTHVDVGEEMLLDDQPEDRHEGQRRDDLAVAESGGGLLVVAGRVHVLH